MTSHDPHTDTPVRKIDISQIRGRWGSYSGKFLSGGDDTIKSIQMVAEKVNELIDLLATPESPTEDKMPSPNRTV